MIITNSSDLKYGDTFRLTYMKSRFIVEYVGGYTLDGERLIEVKFRGDIYVFSFDSVKLERVSRTSYERDSYI